MKNALAEIYSGLKSLFIGMRITIGQFFKPIVTVQYPHETLKIPARFRGHIELVRDTQTGKPKCFVCKLCEKACPSDCITVEGVKPEGAKRKTVTTYRLDFTKCSLCGSCVEACRDGAIRFSREYNLAGLSKEEFIMDLFKKLEAEGKGARPDGQQTIDNRLQTKDQRQETTGNHIGEISRPASLVTQVGVQATAAQAALTAPASTSPSNAGELKAEVK